MSVRMQAIRPRKSPYYNLNDFNSALQAALDDTGKEMLADFKRTTATWETKVDFRIERTSFRVGSRLVSITVGTDNEIYRWVTRGTPAHTITAQNDGRLLFRTGYQAKTKPGRFLSKGGGASGPFVSPRAVQHPGTEARKFEELVQQRHQKRGTLEKNIQKRWTAVAKKA